MALVFVPAFVAYAWLLWIQVQPRIAANPRLRDGYRRLVIGFGFWMALPWLVMGIGNIQGVEWARYFLVMEGQPWVIAFWACVYLEFLLLGYWGVFGNGAQILCDHPGLFDLPSDSPSALRWYIGCFVAFGLVWNTIPLSVFAWLAARPR